MPNDLPQRKSLIQSRALGMRQHYRRPAEVAQDVETLKASRYNIPIKISEGGTLLFNSSSRALSVLDADETEMYHALEAGNASSLSSDKVQGFAAGLRTDGFLLPLDYDEKEAFRDMYMAERQSKQTMLLTIAPTMACNFACGYCFQGLDKDLKKIGPKVPDGIFDFVASHADQLNNLTVCWFGGEPLMSKDAIYALSDRLIALCDKKGIGYSASIVTNGYFLDAATAQKLWTRRCSMAQITVDGGKSSHDKARPLTSGRGTYDVIMKNIGEVLDETPFEIQIRVNVGRDNVDGCSDMLDHFVSEKYAERGSFSVNFAQLEASTAESGTAFEEGLSKADFNRLVIGLGDRAREAGLAGVMQAPGGIMGLCIAARDLGYLISANGDVHKCWETAHDPTKRIGTVFKPDELNDSLNAKLWDAWKPFDNPVCDSCKIAPMCGGACAHRFIYQGAGDEHALPCPDWKWNTAEYLFSRAVSLGVISEDRWIESESTAQAEQSGQRHTAETLLEAQKVVLEKVNANRLDAVDRSFLFEGDGRFFEAESKLQTSAKSDA